MTAVYIILAIFTFIILYTIAEALVLIKQKPAQELPDAEDVDYYRCIIDGKTFEDLYLFLTGEKSDPSFSEEEIYNMLLVQSKYMCNRFPNKHRLYCQKVQY